MASNRPTALLHRFFSGLTEQTFQGELGVADPPLIDYLSDMLIRFLKFDAIFRVRSLDGRPATEVGKMLAEAEARIGLARRDVYRHIGDYTLFWVGIFPESLKDRRGRAMLDRFGDFCSQGKRSYRIASEIESDEEADAPGEVLERLSDDFELCAYGLRQVRREWESRGDDDSCRDLLVN